jgi:serine/threonine-protein kinase
MELLEGEDLGQRLLRQGPLSRDETVGYLWHVALALDRTHQAGIVHRDLKASNLFVTRREDGTALIKVLDFGVAKVLTMERSGEHRTQTVGTPIYMAPEQFRAEGRISPATDIYALGMLSYTLLVGVHYWTREHERCENPFAFASIAVHGPQDNPSARALNEHVLLPPAFDDWFFRATSRWPQDRFPTATGAVSELAAALGVEIPVAPSLPMAPSVLEQSSGSGHLLQATIESPSARLTGVGLHTATSDSVPSPVSKERPKGERTEVSLSVTSGGLPLAPGENPPARGRGTTVVAAAAVVAVVIAAGIGLSLYSNVNNEPGKALAGTRAAPSATVVAAPKPSHEVPRGVTLEELPFALPEVPAGAVAPGVDESTRRGGSARAHPRPPGIGERRGEQGRPGGAESAPGASALAPAAPKTPLPHEDLYGRD